MDQDRTRINILLSCTGEERKNFDPFVEDHVLVLVLQGSMMINDGHDLTELKSGDVGFISRNQLLKTRKTPDDQMPFMSISVFLTQDALQTYAKTTERSKEGTYTGKQNIAIEADVYLKGYFQSMIPYFENPAMLTGNLAAIKTNEAIELLIKERRFQNILFDFDRCFKIDLEAYMNKNYMHHIPIEQFAKLTGRSLSTFKRDFNTVFNEKPNKWLIRKRLTLAHHLITSKKKKPSEVYFEVGFNNFSHFSKAFKSEFGATASAITDKSNSF